MLNGRALQPVFRRSIVTKAPAETSVLPNTLCTLAIESSCDDTSVAILQRRFLPNFLGSYAFLGFHAKITAANRQNRGISPIEALRSHQRNLSLLVQKALNSLPTVRPHERSCLVPEYGRRRIPDFVSVTQGPGMRSNLSTGLDTAKGLALAWGIPLIGVNHMQAHALTPRLKYELDKYPDSALVHDGNTRNRDFPSAFQPAPKVEFPFLSLLVSGGHTMLLHSKNLINHETLGSSRDVAVGEALDKIGREILPPYWLKRAELDDMSYARLLTEYAFPPPQNSSLEAANSHEQELGDGMTNYKAPRRRDEIGKGDNEFGWHVDTPFSQTREVAFTFTGLVTRIIDIYRESSQLPTFAELERLVLARTALTVAFEHLASKTVIALESLKRASQVIETNVMVVSGGVASNNYLRHILKLFLEARGFGHIKLIYPPASLCADNAAMIAWAGMEMYLAGFRSHLDCEPHRKWGMDPKGEDGGIVKLGQYTRLPPFIPSVDDSNITINFQPSATWNEATELFEGPMTLDPKDLKPYREVSMSTKRPKPERIAQSDLQMINYHLRSIRAELQEVKKTNRIQPSSKDYSMTRKRLNREDPEGEKEHAKTDLANQGLASNLDKLEN